MKTRTRKRAPDGKFLKTPDGGVSWQWADAWSLVVAGSLALIAALLLARCHMIWSGGSVTMPIELPRDLLSPLE